MKRPVGPTLLTLPPLSSPLSQAHLSLQFPGINNPLISSNKHAHGLSSSIIDSPVFYVVGFFFFLTMEELYAATSKLSE